MRSLAIIALLPLALAQKTVSIDVGNDDKPQFFSDITYADIGDKVEFRFFGRHSVISGSYRVGCTPLDGGGRVPVSNRFYSGVKTGGTFTIDIKDKDPIWIYCGVEQHCANGMVAVINPVQRADGGQSLSEYREICFGKSNNSPPGPAFGGTDVDGPPFSRTPKFPPSSSSESASETPTSTEEPTSSELATETGTEEPTETETTTGAEEAPTSADTTATVEEPAPTAADNGTTGGQSVPTEAASAASRFGTVVSVVQGVFAAGVAAGVALYWL